MQRENEVNNKCHTRGMLSGISTVLSFQRGIDPRTLRAARCTPPTSGMTGPFYHGTKAFTLIELLVVVLIIGILAAVALPQYNKAVLKSRYVQMIAFARPTYTAWTAHYIANGEYTDNWDELAIDLPGQLTNWNALGDTIRKGNYKCILSDGEHADHFIRLSCVYTDVHGNEIMYIMYPNGSVQCQTQTNWTSGMEVCKSLGGKLRSTDTSWTAYDLSSPS